MSTFLIAKEGDIISVVDTQLNKARYFVVFDALKIYTDYIKDEYVSFTKDSCINCSHKCEEITKGTGEFDEYGKHFMLNEVDALFVITIEENYLIYSDNFSVGLINKPMLKNSDAFTKRFINDYSAGKLSSPEVINVIINNLIICNEDQKDERDL